MVRRQGALRGTVEIGTLSPGHGCRTCRNENSALQELSEDVLETCSELGQGNGGVVNKVRKRAASNEAVLD